MRSVEPESPFDESRDRHDEPALAAPRLVRETCRIVRWRGYVTSEFHVVDESGAVLAVSPAFRWRGSKPPPESEPARAAFDGLVARVIDAGWTPAGRGPHWFAERFARDVPAPPEPPELELEPEWDWEPEPQRPLPAAPPHRQPAPAPLAPAATVAPRPPARAAAPAAAPKAAHPAADGADGDSPEAASRSRRGRMLALAALPVAIALLVYVLVGHDTRRASAGVPPARVPARAAAPKAPARAASHVASGKVAAAAARPPVRPKPARLDLVGIGAAPTWLEARLGSATGRVLFSGMLQPGQALHLRGRPIWVSFGGASDVRVLLNGARIPLEGTLTRVFP